MFKDHARTLTSRPDHLFRWHFYFDCLGISWIKKNRDKRLRLYANLD